MGGSLPPPTRVSTREQKGTQSLATPSFLDGLELTARGFSFRTEKEQLWHLGAAGEEGGSERKGQIEGHEHGS